MDRDEIENSQTQQEPLIENRKKRKRIQRVQVKNKTKPEATGRKGGNLFYMSNAGFLHSSLGNMTPPQGRHAQLPDFILTKGKEVQWEPRP